MLPSTENSQTSPHTNNPGEMELKKKLEKLKEENKRLREELNGVTIERDRLLKDAHRREEYLAEIYYQDGLGPK